MPESKPLQAGGGERFHKALDLGIGGAFVQTYFLGDKPVETQLLYNDGAWRGFTYRWDEDGNDATLVPEAGLNTKVPTGDGTNQPWRFPSRSECTICHQHKSGFALAFNTPQLDRLGPDGRSHQLASWIEAGLLEDNKPLRDRRGNPMPNPHDPATGSLEERARVYLDVNCAHCHREAGLGGRSSFQLMAHLTLEECGLVNAAPAVGLLGIPDAKVVAPGHPERSELLGRMNRRGPARMPLLGSMVIDREGVELIREWIEAMPGNEN